MAGGGVARLTRGGEAHLLYRRICLRRCFAILIFASLAALPLPAQLLRPNGGSNSKIALRKRLHVNTLITEPGTAEVDWGSLYSLSTLNFSMPSGIRYTPAGTHI